MGKSKKLIGSIFALVVALFMMCGMLPTVSANDTVETRTLLFNGSKLLIDGTDEEYTGQTGCWSIADNTLSLNNFSFETTASTALRTEGTVNIAVSGTNTIAGGMNNTSAADVTNGILSTGSLNITGAGTLNVAAAEANQNSLGINAQTLTLNLDAGGVLNAKGNNAGMFGVGIKASALTVDSDGARINADGPDGPLTGFATGLEVGESFTFTSGTLYASSVWRGALLKNISIAEDAALYAKGSLYAMVLLSVSDELSVLASAENDFDTTLSWASISELETDEGTYVVKTADGSDALSAKLTKFVETGSLFLKADGLYIRRILEGEEGYEDEYYEKYTLQTDKWSYSYGILTLNDGFDFTTTSNIGLIIDVPSYFNDVKISLEGTSKIECLGTYEASAYSRRNSAAISSQVPLTFTGSGTLNVTGADIAEGSTAVPHGIWCENTLTADLEKNGRVNVFGGKPQGNTPSIGISADNITVKGGSLNAVGGSAANGASIGAYISHADGTVNIVDGSFTASCEEEQGTSHYAVASVNENLLSDMTYAVCSLTSSGPFTDAYTLAQTTIMHEPVHTYSLSGSAASAAKFTHRVSDQSLLFKDKQLYIGHYDNDSKWVGELYTGQAGLWEIGTEEWNMDCLVLHDGFSFFTSQANGLYVEGDGTILTDGRLGSALIKSGVDGADGPAVHESNHAIFAKDNLTIKGYGTFIVESGDVALKFGGDGQIESVPNTTAVFCNGTLTVDMAAGELQAISGKAIDYESSIYTDFYGMGIFADKLVMNKGYVNVSSEMYGIETCSLDYRGGGIDITCQKYAALFIFPARNTGDFNMRGSATENDFDNLSEVIVNTESSAFMKGVVLTEDPQQVAKTLRIMPADNACSLAFDGKELKLSFIASDNSFLTIPYTENTDKWSVDAQGRMLILKGGFDFETSAYTVLILADNVSVDIQKDASGLPVRLTCTDEDDSMGSGITAQNVTFTGDGSLVINSGDRNQDSLLYGINADVVTIDMDLQGVIDISTSTESESYGIKCSDSLNLLRGTLKAKSSVHGVSTRSLNVLNGTVEASASGRTGYQFYVFCSAISMKNDPGDAFKANASTAFDDFGNLSPAAVNAYRGESSDTLYYFELNGEAAKSVRLKGNANTLMLKFNADEKTLSLCDGAMSMPYTEQTDKWSIGEDGVLSLKDGFYFESSANTAMQITSRNGAVINLEGTSSIVRKNADGSGNTTNTLFIDCNTSFTGSGTLNVINNAGGGSYASAIGAQDDTVNVNLDRSGRINAVVNAKQGDAPASVVAADLLRLSMTDGIFYAEAPENSGFSLGIKTPAVLNAANITGGIIIAKGADYAFLTKQSFSTADYMRLLGSAQYNASSDFTAATLRNENEGPDESNDYSFVLADNSIVKTLYIAPVTLDIGCDDPNHKYLSGEDLRFVCNGELGDFIRAYVDGDPLGSEDCDIISGSTILTLKAEYLNSLKPGTHTLVMEYTYANVTTTFTVEGPASSPQTGDDTHIVLWLTLILTDIIFVAVYMAKRKKNRNDVR